MRSGSGAQFLFVKPAIPHKFEHLSPASRQNQPALPPQFVLQNRSASFEDTSLIPRQPEPLPRTPAPRQSSAPRSPLHREYTSHQMFQPRNSEPKPESQNLSAPTRAAPTAHKTKAPSAARPPRTSRCT